MRAKSFNHVRLDATMLGRKSVLKAIPRFKNFLPVWKYALFPLEPIDRNRAPGPLSRWKYLLSTNHGTLYY